MSDADTPSPAPQPHRNKGGGRPFVKSAYKLKGNTRPALRLRDVETALASEIGTSLGDMALSRRVLVQAAALAIVEVERMRAAITRDGEVPGNDIVRASGQLQRLLDALGLSPEGLERRKAAEAEAERKRLLDQHYPDRKWD